MGQLSRLRGLEELQLALCVRLLNRLSGQKRGQTGKHAVAAGRARGAVLEGVQLRRIAHGVAALEAEDILMAHGPLIDGIRPRA